MSRGRGEDEEAGRLVIDHAAAVETPPDDEIRVWAGSQRVFVSSVIEELSAERKSAADAIRAVGGEAVLFEEFGGRDSDPHQAYLTEVASSHIYVGILGRRYGLPLPTRFSATHTEYRHAEERGLRLCLWVADVPDREGREQSFVDEVRVFHVVPSFRSTDDLKRQIETRLRRIGAEELSPWCKFGDVVFRAKRVVERREEIEVEAIVRSDDVAHALDEMRPDRWNRGHEARFTWDGKSLSVRMTDAQITTTATRSRIYTLRLETIDNHRDALLEVTFGRYKPDDVTELALKAVLFGERNPLEDEHFGFAAPMPDPFKMARGQRISDEIVRPIAQVLLTEALVGSGRASRITSLKLGPAVRGRRRLEISWQTPRRYAGERPQVRQISGELELA